MRHFWETITSKAYWKYVLFSRVGFESVLKAFGLIYLVVEALDFFKVFTRDEYGQYAFPILLAISVAAAIYFRRPVRRVVVRLPQRDLEVEVVIDDLFESDGAAMISTNTLFESDVAGGKIALDSLQGQFTARYFPGNQTELINQIGQGLGIVEGDPPFPMGTTVEIHTHGKTFYFTAMSELNDQGNASSTLEDIQAALNGLWAHVRDSGELQEIAVPVVGTGRGRVQLTRKKMIGLIASSFVEASDGQKISEKLVIVVRPEDARKFQVNLYDVQDHLSQLLHS